MNSVLNEIKSIPGITGGFIFGPTHGIVANNLPSVFKEQNLDKIGNSLDKMYSSSKSNFTDVTELSLYYEESTLIVRPVGKTSLLVIICDPSINHNLLTMILNMVADKIEKIGTELDQADNKNEQEQLPAPSEKISPEEFINDGPLSKQLQGMQKALFKIVGPMAKIIFKDAVSIWIESNSPTSSSFPRLFDILREEINDVEKEERYFTLITPFLQSYQDND